MKSRNLTQVVGITALAALAISPPLYARGEGNISCTEGEIITFDAPHAGKGPGSAFCFNSCPGTEPYNNNVWGAVTGYVVEDTNQYHGFVRYPNGKITEFDAPGASPLPGFGTVGYSINTEGMITGQYEDASSVFHGYVRWPNGTFETFEAPGAGTGGLQGTFPLNINDVGEVTGWYLDASSLYHTFLRPLHGPIIEFEAPGAGTGPFQGTTPAGPAGQVINALGAVNGGYIDGSNTQHGWVRYPNGTIQTFDAPGAQATFGGGINNLGVIAGGFFDSSGVIHGLIRAANGTIATFDAPGAGTVGDMFFGTVPTANNDFGVTAGYSVDNNNVSHGFIRFPNANIKVFDVKGAGSSAGQGTAAWGLNEEGQITGVWTDANNVNHGYIRSPDFCW